MNNKEEYPEWIKDSDDQCLATRRPLPKSNQERVYVFDKDYRCDPWDRPDLYDQSSPAPDPLATSSGTGGGSSPPPVVVTKAGAANKPGKGLSSSFAREVAASGAEGTSAERINAKNPR